MNRCSMQRSTINYQQSTINYQPTTHNPQRTTNNNQPTMNTFDISIWERADRQNRESREQSRQKVLKDLSGALDQLSLNYKWDELYIFGSVSQSDRFSERSDVDIGIQGLDKHMHYRFVAELSNLMERDVDVVRLEDCSFAEAIRTRGIQWKREN